MADKARRKSERKESGITVHEAPKRDSWIWNVIYADPATIVTGAWDAFDLWRSTRNWRSLIWFTPALLVLFVCFGTILWGMTRSKDALRDRYLALAEQEAPIMAQSSKDAVAKVKSDVASDSKEAKEVSDKPDDKSGVQFSDYADLLYRRVLQLESNNVRARYYVAYRVGASGNVVQAREMMKELAPDNAKGFEPAHAWMAMDMIQRFGRRELDDRARPALLHHLSIASTWEDVDVNLLLVYAGLLESQGRIDEALRVARIAAGRDSSLRLAVAEICARAKYTTQAKDEATAAIKVLQQNFGTQLEKENERVGVARAYLIRNEPDEAIKVLAEGLQYDQNRPLVKRMLSEVLRLKYRSTFRQTANGIELNMNLLENAAKVDPSNPAVGEEIAQLSQLGVTASDSVIETLKRQLASGTASAITHTLLGNAYASRKQMPKAISHWELALGQNPNLVIVLNNLAVALTEQAPSNAPRSLEMIDRALKIVGGNDAELFDSRGAVLLASGNAKDSISWFEKAIAIDPKRPGTREGIIKAAEKAELPDLAEIHRVALAELQAQLALEAEAKKMEEAANAGMSATRTTSAPPTSQTPKPVAKPTPVAAPQEGLPPSVEYPDPTADDGPSQNIGSPEGKEASSDGALNAGSPSKAKAELILGPETIPESTDQVEVENKDPVPPKEPDEGDGGR